MEQSYLYTKANKKKLDKWREEIDKENSQENSFDFISFLNVLASIDKKIKEYQRPLLEIIEDCTKGYYGTITSQEVLLSEIKKYLYVDNFGMPNDFCLSFCEHEELDFIISTCLKKKIDANQREQIREEIISELNSCEICESELDRVVDEVANNLIYIKENNMQEDILINREKQLLNSVIDNIIPFVDAWWSVIKNYLDNIKKQNVDKYVKLAFANTYDVISIVSFEAGNEINYDKLKSDFKDFCKENKLYYCDETFDIVKGKLLSKRQFWIFYVKYKANKLLTDIVPESFIDSISQRTKKKTIWNEFIGKWDLGSQVSMAVNDICKKYEDISSKQSWETDLIYSVSKEALYEILRYEKKYKNEEIEESFEWVDGYGKKLFRQEDTLLVAAIQNNIDGENCSKEKFISSDTITLSLYYSPIYEVCLQKSTNKLENGMGKKRNYRDYYYKIRNLRNGVTIMESYMLEKQTGLLLATLVYASFVSVIGKISKTKHENLICEVTKLAGALSNIHNLDIRLNIAMDIMEVVKDILKEDTDNSIKLLKQVNSILDGQIYALNNDYDKVLKRMIIEFAPDKKWKGLINCANMPTTGFKRGIDFLEQLESDMKNNLEIGNGQILFDLLESNSKYKTEQYGLFSRIMQEINISVEIE